MKTYRYRPVDKKSLTQIYIFRLKDQEKVVEARIESGFRWGEIVLRIPDTEEELLEQKDWLEPGNDYTHFEDWIAENLIIPDDVLNSEVEINNEDYCFDFEELDDEVSRYVEFSSEHIPKNGSELLKELERDFDEGGSENVSDKWELWGELSLASAPFELVRIE